MTSSHEIERRVYMHVTAFPLARRKCNHKAPAPSIGDDWWPCSLRATIVYRIPVNRSRDLVTLSCLLSRYCKSFFLNNPFSVPQNIYSRIHSCSNNLIKIDYYPRIIISIFKKQNISNFKTSIIKKTPSENPNFFWINIISPNNNRNIIIHRIQTSSPTKQSNNQYPNYINR